MKISTKCSLALHSLIIIALFGSKKITSDIIAQSTGCNPVIIRNLMGRLKKAGILNIQRGTGGASLRIDPKDITIWAVYNAVDPKSLSGFIGVHPNPSNTCPVGSKIHALLSVPHQKMEEAVRQVMSEYTLAELIQEFQQMNG